MNISSHVPQLRSQAGSPTTNWGGPLRALVLALGITMLSSCDGRDLGPASWAADGASLENGGDVVVTARVAENGMWSEVSGPLNPDGYTTKPDGAPVLAGAGNSELTTSKRPEKIGNGEYRMPDGSTAKLTRRHSEGGSTTTISFTSPTGDILVAELTWTGAGGTHRLVHQQVSVLRNGKFVAFMETARVPQEGIVEAPIAAVTALSGREGPQLATAAGLCQNEINAAYDALTAYWAACTAAGISVLGGPIGFLGGGVALMYCAYMVDLTQQRLDECIAGA